jgi:ADP-ribosylglycohydrolase
MGTPENPGGRSTGAHALTRTLPAGLIGWWGSDPGGFAAEVAATTHGGDAVTAAAVGATIVAGLAEGRALIDAAEQAPSALEAARSAPGRMSVLGGLAPDARAMSALAGGVYVALSFPEPEQVREALAFAASGGPHVAAVTGALLGTAHGVDALPVDGVSRLELAWVADVLARDLVAEFVDRPSGGEYEPASDPGWWDRYPGW